MPRSMRRVRPLFLFTLLVAALPLCAQTSEEISFQRTFLLRNVSGTAANPGPVSHHPHLFSRGDWTMFGEGAVFLSYATETGPPVQRNEAFSTNWVAGGAQRQLGRRGLVLFKARASLEPFTIKQDGYPQLLQSVSTERGGPLADRMRAQDLLGEAAVHLAYRTSTASFLHLYAAPIGAPPVGAVPYAQRASSEEFAEAPYAYDVQESFHHATRVVTAGFATPWFGLEGGVFHDAPTFGRHTETGDGKIDSRAARLTITPVRNLSFQASRAELGDSKLKVNSASLSYGGEAASASGIWTSRQSATGVELHSLALEMTFRADRNTFMGRVESVDRPVRLARLQTQRTTHYAAGYIFDVLRGPYRAGIGANLDYHTNTHDLPADYGHKPQTIYLFVRLRTDSASR
ncbi:MAG: hypothetical protein JWN02_2572 [Acidobacteria bacterium]|nr:hypothetical protein [Acidobacteriota bacterium]